jgi:hypothetical protein
VDARHDEVERLKHFVGIVQRAIRQDVGFDAFQDPEALPKRLVELVSLPVLLLDLFDREPAGVVRGLRVVRHPEILETAVLWRKRHRNEAGNCIYPPRPSTLSEAERVKATSEMTRYFGWHGIGVH